MTGWLDEALLIAGLKAFGIAVILTPILRDIFRINNIVDRPGHRRVHTYPIPRIGGIPIALGYAVALYGLSDILLEELPVWKLLPAGLVFLVGLLDDFISLRPLVKLAGQITAAVWIFFNGVRLDTLGTSVELPLWINLGLTVFWLLLTTNALNLIDGLDGLCGGIGLLATLTMFGAAILYGNTPLMYVTFPLACTLLGFLCYNVNPATVFMGDSGALTVGFLIGCYGMFWTQKTTTLISLLVPLMALSVPLLDVVVAVVRRFLQRQPIFGADRGHIHHRLLDRGLTPRNAVLVLYLFAALAAGLAMLLSAPQMGRFRNLVVVVLLVAIWLGLRELRYEEFNQFGKMLFSGALQDKLRNNIRLDRMNIGLAAAAGPADWWDVLVELAHSCRWKRLHWQGPDKDRSLGLYSEPGDWTLQVSLGDWGHLEVEGSGAAVDLAELAAALKASAAQHTKPAASPTQSKVGA